jgi:hypothetical protein
MDPVTIGLVSLGIGGGLKILGSLFDDSGEQKAAIMHEQANMKLAALEETQRRAEGQQTQVLSSTKARMGATGFASESASYENYLTGMAEEFTKQNTFAMSQGKREVALLHQAADLQDTDFMTKMLGVGADVAGTAGKMAGLL